MVDIRRPLVFDLEAEIAVEVGCRMGAPSRSASNGSKTARRFFVFDVDQLQRGLSDVFVVGGHCRDALTVVAHATIGQRRSILDAAAPQTAVARVSTGDNGVHTR